MTTLTPWILASRPKTLPAAVVPVLLGSAIAWDEGGFALAPMTVCLVFAVLVQIGTNFANDYFDFVKGADGVDRIGPARAVASGWISPEAMFRATVIILGLAFVVGLLLLVYGGVWLLLIGVASILSAVAYTGGPYPLGYNGLGDVFVIAFFGLIAVGFTFFVQAGYFSPLVWPVGLACGLVINNLLVVNNFRDYHSDLRAGKRTLAVRFGRSFVWYQYIASNAIALAVPVFLLAFPGGSRWLLLPLVLAIPMARLGVAMKRAHDREEFDWVLANTAKVLVGYGLLLTIGILA